LVFLDIFVGRTKQKNSKQRTHYPVRKGDIEIFTHGKDLFDDLFAEIKSAKDHIHILFYIARDDEFSKSFFQLLKTKAQEGVEVCLLLDWLGSHKVTKQMVQELKTANAKFAYSNKPKLPLLYMANVRNHRKISIIDGKVGYLGGYNVGKEYINLHPKLTPWRDYHLKITGESVQDLQKEFLRDWQDSTKSLLMNQDYFPIQSNGHSNIQFIPSDGVTLEGDFLKLIQKAQHSIFIGTPYFIPSKILFAELLHAIKRGVRLTILVPCITDHPLVQEASYHYFRILLKAGANIHQFTNGFYHAKLFLVDEEICDIGTANFDKRSLFLNYEMNCYIYDPHIIGRVKTIIEKDLLDSKKMELKDLEQLGFWSSVKEGVARVLSPLL
jgi:cardiolipin synthase A/B